MATDYDAPRTAPDRPDDHLVDVAALRAGGRTESVDADRSDGGFDPPGGDILDEELSVAVMPIRADEFRCARCFLIHHRSQRSEHNGQLLCRDCS
jgi:hypothetical protein